MGNSDSSSSSSSNGEWMLRKDKNFITNNNNFHKLTGDLGRSVKKKVSNYSDKLVRRYRRFDY